MSAVVLPQTVPVTAAWQHITSDDADGPRTVLVPVQVFHRTSGALHQWSTGFSSPADELLELGCGLG